MDCECDADCTCRPGYNGSAIVQRSLELDEPVIFVALNYRLAHLHVCCIAYVCLRRH